MDAEEANQHTEAAGLAEPLLARESEHEDVEHISFTDADKDDHWQVIPRSCYVISTVITAKTILGAGMAALPRAFSLTGVIVGTFFLLGIAWMTQFTVWLMARCSVRTHAPSYFAILSATHGQHVAFLLQLCLLLRCAGLMTVYMVILGDVLAGSVRGSIVREGLVCQTLGQAGQPWCGNRALIIAVVLITCILPLVTAGQLQNTAWSSWLGMSGIAIWCSVTLVLSASALWQGKAYAWPLLPDTQALGDSGTAVFTQLCGIIAIVATAYTCQMTMHFVMRGIRPFRLKAMDSVSFWGVSICTVVFLTVSLGSLLLVGDQPPADILEAFNVAQISTLMPVKWAAAICTVVRLCYLASICTIFPMQMLPFRQAAIPLLLPRRLQGNKAMEMTLVLVSTFAIYLMGVFAKSIWGPLQLVGATAGALIAFIFPGMFALHPLGHSGSHWVKVAGWALITVGALQAVAGVVSVIAGSA